MAQNTTLVTLPQLIDLSLNCPEMGSINYNILHILLHVLLQQVEQTDVAIEFRGEDSDRIQTLITAMRPQPTVYLSQYEICGGKTKRKPAKKISLQDIKERSKEEKLMEEEINIIEPRKKSTDEPNAHPPPMKSPPGSQKQLRTGSQTVVVVGESSSLPQFSIAITKSHFDQLVADVTNIKTQMKELSELPANMGLIEATRSPSNPVLDMFQILKLTKRVDAAEEGINKMASLVGDLAREQGQTDIDTTTILIPKKSITKESEEHSTKQSEETHSIKASEPPSMKGPNAHATKKYLARVNFLESRIKKMERVMKKILEGGDVSKVEAELETEQEPTGEKSDLALEEVPDEPIINAKFTETLEWLQIELDKIKLWIDQQGGMALIPRESVIREDGEMETSPAPRLSPDLDKKFTECVNKITAIDQNYNGQINTLQDQMGSLQREVGDLLLKINTILPGGDNDELNIDNQRKLYEKLKQLEKEVVVINETAVKLQEDKEERDKSIHAMLEQIDLLKLVKANREDLEDALDDKADACLINRKVSHDQFDAACDDLTKGIEQAIEKLTQQEEMWKQAMISIQRDVGQKLDKAEVDPLRDFVNNKLKALQEKFKSLTALKKEQEAAGTKSKFLRNVNCISCDKDVVMRKEMDPSLKPQAHAVPPNRNIAPYLAYELDQLRKQQKCIPNSKNLNFFENAMKQKMVKDKTHICNRYCGGSHTITTPQQRVTRLGHFLEQWGPEVSPLNDEFVKGTNNHMYKARDDAALKKMVEQDRNKAQLMTEEIVTKDSEHPEQATVVDATAQELLLDQARITGASESQRGSVVPDPRRISVLDSRRVSTPGERRVSVPADRKVSSTMETRRVSAIEERRSSTPIDMKRVSTTEERRVSTPGDKKRFSAAEERRVSTPGERRVSTPADDRRVSMATEERRASTPDN